VLKYKNRMNITGEIGQWLGVIMFLAGIAIEITYKAHAGFILITSAAFMFTIATKLKYGKRKL